MPNSGSRRVRRPVMAGAVLSPTAPWLGAWGRELMRIRFCPAILSTLPLPSTATSIRTLAELSCRSAITESPPGSGSGEAQGHECIRSSSPPRHTEDFDLKAHESCAFSLYPCVGQDPRFPKNGCVQNDAFRLRPLLLGLAFF